VASKKKNWPSVSKAQDCMTTALMYLGDDEGFDKHNHAASNHGSQSSDIHGTQDIEDYIAWTGQLFD
jgi:hypothetical protein